jgi:hypothetical protein
MDRWPKTGSLEEVRSGVTAYAAPSTSQQNTHTVDILTTGTADKAEDSPSTSFNVRNPVRANVGNELPVSNESPYIPDKSRWDVNALNGLVLTLFA